MYDHSGFDKIILVEDDLAKAIVDRLLRENQLMNSKLVHVLPCGGYTNVIDLANDVVRFNLLGRKASVSIILDGDVKDKSQNYINKKGIINNIPLNYLPVESLEKYLKQRLFESVDHKLFRELNDYVFHGKSLDEIVAEYKRTDTSKDRDGKKFYSMIESELQNLREDRNTITEFIVKYLFDNNDSSLEKLVEFLRKQMI